MGADSSAHDKLIGRHGYWEGGVCPTRAAGGFHGGRIRPKGTTVMADKELVGHLVAGPSGLGSTVARFETLDAGRFELSAACEPGVTPGISTGLASPGRREEALTTPADTALALERRIERRKCRVARWGREAAAIEPWWLGGPAYRQFCEQLAAAAGQQVVEIGEELNRVRGRTAGHA